MATSSRRGKGERGRHSDRGSDRDRDRDPLVTLSKSLSWLLRHNAVKEGLEISEAGYVDLTAVLAHPRFSNWTEEDVRKVVAQNDKQRFSLKEEGNGGRVLIRANQGHSIEVDETQLLQEISAPSDLPSCPIHGTYFRFWDSIRKEGLSKMKRNHIHFAAGEPGDEGVISGMRSSAQIYIYVDIEKAVSDGIKFYRSDNNVILTPGDERGLLPTKYFKKVVDIKKKIELDF